MLSKTYKGEMMDRFLRLPEVEHITGLKKSAIWKWIQENRFPKGIQLSKKTTVWRESAIKKWQDSFDIPIEESKPVKVQETPTVPKQRTSRRNAIKKSEV